MRGLHLLPLLWLAPSVALAAVENPSGTALATGGLPTGDLASAALRMTAGLAVVLGLLLATAWLSRKYRVAGRLRGGLIEVVSGLSLGTRERVVLLKVGDEQVLVGISPSGLRTLHVLNTPVGTESAPAAFSSLLDRPS
jgi:flagellar protein FliO/FliZ